MDADWHATCEAIFEGVQTPEWESVHHTCKELHQGKTSGENKKAKALWALEETPMVRECFTIWAVCNRSKQELKRGSFVRNPLAKLGGGSERGPEAHTRRTMLEGDFRGDLKVFCEKAQCFQFARAAGCCHSVWGGELMC